MTASAPSLVSGGSVPAGMTKPFMLGGGSPGTYHRGGGLSPDFPAGPGDRDYAVAERVIDDEGMGQLIEHTGVWTPEDRFASAYHYLPADVPPGTAALRVALHSDRD